MKVRKIELVQLLLENEDTSIFRESLRKIINVETTIGVNVLKILSSEELKLLKAIQKEISNE